MSNILTLLRLEFQNKFGSINGLDKKQIARPLITLIFVAGIIGIIYWGAGVYFEMFAKAGMAYEALIFLFTAMFIILLVTGISSTVKVLYYKGDNLILMRFPVSGSEVFISKTLFLFISQLLITIVILAPFISAYGNVMETGTYFYAIMPVVIGFMVLIPFFLSNILAIPIMHITNKIRNRFALIIIGLSVIMTALFAAYMFLFKSIVTFLRDSSFSVFSDEVVVIIKDIAEYIIPTKYFADILVSKELYIAYPVMIGMTALAFIGTVFVIAKLYQKTLLANVEVEGSAFKHKTKNRVTPIFFTLLRKEFIQVFRSVNYSFQYFVLACSMPVMVYFCNDIALNIGKNDIGEQIVVGMTILVMLIFATVIISFAATSVSREGRCFYQTKVMPTSIHTQLAAKFIMYMIVSVCANVACIAILVFTEIMEWKIALWVFAIVQLISVALTLIAMRMDINHPTFNLSGEGEVVNNNANTTGSIILGFIISVTEGIVAMVTAFLFVGNSIMMISCSIIAGVFILIAVLVYTINLKKAYNRISK